MPKAAPDEVIIHRIEFQESERKLLESYLLAYSAGKIGEMGQGLGVPEIAKMLDDPLKIVQVASSLATIIEFFGVETGWPTAADASGALQVQALIAINLTIAAWLIYAIGDQLQILANLGF